MYVQPYLDQNMRKRDQTDNEPVRRPIGSVYLDTHLSLTYLTQSPSGAKECSINHILLAHSLFLSLCFSESCLCSPVCSFRSYDIIDV